MSRRFWRRLCLLVGLALPVAGCAADPASAGGAGKVSPAAVQVAAGVYMLPGLPGEPDVNNQGRIGNAGFIVGPTGVIAIDTGTSYRHGRDLLQAIAQVTDQPVRLVLITHARQEFVFGGAAFIERNIPIHMQRRTALLMAARCEGCLKTLQRELGDAVMNGTRMFKPDLPFDDPLRIETIGRPVQVLHFGHSSGPGDIVVLDETSQVLFAGGLIDHLHVPEVQDADLAGWRKALAVLRAMPLAAIVPGHGPLATPAAIDATLGYLDRLEARVQDLLRKGAALSDVPDQATLPEYRGWGQYEVVHRRNASVLFVKLEHQQMFK